MKNISIQRAPPDPVMATQRASPPVSVPGNSVEPVTVAPIKQEANRVAPQAVKTALSSDDVKKLASEMQRKFATISSDLQFSVDEETGKNLIKVTDRTTKQIVWQFPSEDALKITKELDRYQKGVMLNRQA